MSLAAFEPPPGALLAVVGPTASGKTALAIRLAERFGGEIIGADSVQIYRHFDLASGKPDAHELARAPHHLISALDPLEPVDAAGFAARAEALLGEIRARGRLPIICGGTFLWVKALLWGLAPSPPADEAIRARHRALVAAEGPAALHARLAAVDPEAALRLAPNDLLRVGRALEVFEASGRTQTAWHAEHGFREERHAHVLVTPAVERSALEERIPRRVASFFAAGLVDEVRGLLARGYGAARAMGSVGYREVAEHLSGERPHEGLEEAVVRATRVYVRRQRTWLRDLPITRLDDA